MHKHLRTFLSFFLLTLMPVSAMAIDYEFSYATPGAELNLLGYERSEHYDVGIYIPATGLTEANAKLTKIWALAVKNEKIKNFKMWASTTFEDPGVGMHFSGNIFNANATIEDTEDPNFIKISCELTSPYPVGEDGLYVGYSFDVSAVDGSKYTKYPVVVTEEANGNDAMICRGAKNYHSLLYFDDISLYCTAVFSGNFLNDAVRVIGAPIYSSPGQTAEYHAEIINQGINSVSEIEYSYQVKDMTGTGTIDVNLAARPGFTQAITVPIEVADATGQFQGTFAITKVNGNENTGNPTSTGLRLTVLEHMTTHRPVMEEYTGTWCGWCPRGMAGMQLCKDEIDDFIAIAYHKRDIMELAADTPESSLGFPSATIDRGEPMDPYYGSSGEVPGGILTDYLARKEVVVPADVEVSAVWNEDASALQISSSTVFAFIPEDGFNYRLAYVVIEDGIHGQDAGYAQANYFSKSYGKGDPYLNQYYEAPSYIAGLEFNDVAVYTTAIRGVARSLPKTNELEAGVAYEHEYEAKLSDFKRKDGTPSYQDLGHMKIVALLVKQDSNTGSISNANEAAIAAPAAITDVLADSGVESVEYYDILGKRISAPASGLCIRKEILSDGSVRTTKLVIR